MPSSSKEWRNCMCLKSANNILFQHELPALWSISGGDAIHKRCDAFVAGQDGFAPLRGDAAMPHRTCAARRHTFARGFGEDSHVVTGEQGTYVCNTRTVYKRWKIMMPSIGIEPTAPWYILTVVRRAQNSKVVFKSRGRLKFFLPLLNFTVY